MLLLKHICNLFTLRQFERLSQSGELQLQGDKQYTFPMWIRCEQLQLDNSQPAKFTHSLLFY